MRHHQIALLALLTLILGGLARPTTPVVVAQQPAPVNTSLTLSGEMNLPPSVYVFAQSSTSYGIYYLEGSNWQLVTSIPVSAATVDRVIAKLSPDAQQVAFLVNDGETGNSALYVTDRFGTNTRTINTSTDPALAVTSFAWRGVTQVAYTLARGPFAAEASAGTALNVIEQSAQSAYTGEVWISDTDGQSQTQLVSTGAGTVIGSVSTDSRIFYTTVNTATQELTGLNSVKDDGTIAELLRSQVNAEGHGTNYLSFDLAQTTPGVMRIVAVTASEVGSTMPEGGTQLVTTALDGSNMQVVLSDTLDIARAVWSPDGTKVGYVRQSNGELSIRDLNNGTTSTLPNAVRSNIQWDASGSQVVTLDALNSDSNPFTKGLNIQTLDGSTVASAETQATSSTNFVRVLVPGFNPTTFEPYVHQKLDTPQSFSNADKGSSCGSSSTVTVLASLGKVNAPIGNRVPEFHNGHLYNGVWVPSASRGLEPVEIALIAYGVKQTPNFRLQNNLQGIINAVERNHAVIIGTGLTSGDGHIVTIIGYDRSGNDVRLIVNDSWGNKNSPRYGTQRDGAGVVYTWETLSLGWKWNIEINATAPGAGTYDTYPNQWRGEYYPNTAFSGVPVVRGDNAINFNWGAGNPLAGIPADNFSARWKRTATFPSSGVYRFRTTSDDGLRIYIDGRPILNQWYPHPPTQVNSDVYVAGGQHTIVVEYYEAAGGAQAQVDWVYQSPSGLWEGNYYNNPTLTGEPAFVRQDTYINFGWGAGNPGVGIAADNFSVRWTGNLNLPGGAWQFYTSSDDGSRVFLNGKLIVNQWQDHPVQSAYSTYSKLDAGQKNVTVDFYERGGGASMQFSYWPRIQAEYWDRRDFSGTYKSAVLDSVDQNWGLSGPHKEWWQLQDNFSTRYTWPVSLRGGNYKICIDSDDGFRFYVDEKKEIDRWYDSNGTSCQNVAISAGWKTFRVDHYENGGMARVRMTWGRADGTAWYGTAQPSSSGAVTYVTDDQAALMAVEPAQADTVEDYFRILHEHGTLGLGLEAQNQATDTALYNVLLPIVIR